ncbi:hypothetical protein PENTCL1PPCAC_19993, partial [Pristionchus entomophagus]
DGSAVAGGRGEAEGLGIYCIRKYTLHLHRGRHHHSEEVVEEKGANLRQREHSNSDGYSVSDGRFIIGDKVDE